MATSESDDFESADEELGTEPTRRPARRNWSSPTAIDSESDDDTECLPPSYEEQEKRSNVREAQRPALFDKNDMADKPRRDTHTRITDPPANQSDKAAVETVERPPVRSELDQGNERSTSEETDKSLVDHPSQGREQEERSGSDGKQMVAESSSERSECKAKERARVRPQRRPEGPKSLGAKKLGTRIAQSGDGKPTVELDLSEKLEQLSTSPEQEERIPERLETKGENERSLMNELAEPEELKSDKKFKEVFDPQGWEGLGSDIELPDELTEEKLQPVLERLSSAGQESENASGWGGWGSWGVSTLLNTATAGVSTLTSHVSHGLTLLEESIGTPDSTDSDKTKEESSIADEKASELQESPSMTSFGFGNLMSGVSSITKLVESTSSKVMSGGLDTLEAIGKKTMEVLQEGDPGLKKKRAFFINESDKPNLSHVLREAKEKADAAEKTYEEKQWARKIHFESLFDDYQGLVHLEALEMLSKQSTMKIQQRLINLNGDELTSIQETLEDVKELCDPTDEDDDEEDSNEKKDLRLRLHDACSDLGIDISYDKLCTVWDESEKYLEPPVERTDQEIFQAAISALAQFTAFSIERFHKTAELILIKPRRSTVNEADALVQLTRILSNQIGLLANCYCNTLNEAAKQSDNSEQTNANITTVFLEATNASSYVQDAFRLLIPIVQVGAI